MSVVELTNDIFETTIKENDFVIIDFWAPWCGPCQNFAPIYKKVSEEYPDIVFAKVNTEDEVELARHFQIRSIPTLMIFREQIIIYAEAGMLPESQFKALIEKAKDLNMADVKAEIEKNQSQDG